MYLSHQIIRENHDHGYLYDSVSGGGVQADGGAGRAGAGQSWERPEPPTYDPPRGARPSVTGDRGSARRIAADYSRTHKNNLASSCPAG